MDSKIHRCVSNSYIISVLPLEDCGLADKHSISEKRNRCANSYPVQRKENLVFLQVIRMFRLELILSHFELLKAYF